MKGITLEINSENDMFVALHHVRLLLKQLSFSDMDKQKVIVSASELIRNVLEHANAEGSISCEIVEGRGLRVIVQDQGQGIDRLDELLKGERRANSRGLGLGLAGAKRMMDEFTISTSKEGTTIVCTKWITRACAERK